MLEYTTKRYKDQPLTVAETGEVRINWNMTLYRKEVEAQSTRYYCSAQRHMGMDIY